MGVNKVIFDFFGKLTSRKAPANGGEFPAKRLPGLDEYLKQALDFLCDLRWDL